MFDNFKLTVLVVSLNVVTILCFLLPTASEDIDVLHQSMENGYSAIQYDVITDDGYILQLFNIPGKSKYPVLLMHGISDTADTWLVRGNASLGITLANAGYDVWLGNCRGNKYGRRHEYLDPDTDSAFWDFTFHEHGVLDLPAIIDTILKFTSTTKLNAIGHSQGNTIFYVLGSSRPEYNSKVNLLTALAPVCYLDNIGPPLNILFSVMPTLNEIAKKNNIHEVFGNKQLPGRLLRSVCSIPHIGYHICIENVLFSISGADPDEFNPEIFKKVNTYFPSSTSRKNFDHFGQIFNRKKFARYDYGVIMNRSVYNSSKPPRYNLKKVSMPIAFIVGLNDNISRVEDIAILQKQLGNVVNYTISPRKSFNHMDDIWGENMSEYLFPSIFHLLEKYI